MASAGIRERVRAEYIREITATARRHIAEHGAAELSLRAVAREVGIAPSALYRYFPDRNALLDSLRFEARESLGEAAAAGESKAPRADYLARWRSTFHAVHDWALENPQEYALIYGPYRSDHCPHRSASTPEDPVILLLAGILRDGAEGITIDSCLSNEMSVELKRNAEINLSALLSGNHSTNTTRRELSPRTLIDLIGAWTTLHGAINLELCGHYDALIDARNAHIEYIATSTAKTLSLEGA